MDFLEIWSAYRPAWTRETYLVVAGSFIFTLGILLFVAYLSNWSKKRTLVACFLGLYVVFVYASTVFTRPATPGPHYELELFWSYRWGIASYGHGMYKEILLNVALLMPIGLCLPYSMGKRMKHRMIITIVVGALVSVTIELLQLIRACGLFEFDDIFHNTLGVILGCIIVQVVSWIFFRRRR